MEVWESTILSWVNSLGTGTPITKMCQLRGTVSKILNKIAEQLQGSQKNLADFIIQHFPNYFPADIGGGQISSDFDFLCAVTLLLVFISLSGKPELEIFKQSMCSKLDNAHQVHVAEFLINMQKYGEISQISLGNIKEEIDAFLKCHVVQPQTMIGDGFKPIKTSPEGCSSPLVQFFQTPKRKTSRKETCMTCCDGSRLKQIKLLQDQLIEEELEKSTLHENLKIKSEKCLDYEMKLKNKIEEIKQMKHEWEVENQKNLEEMVALKSEFQRKHDNEKRLKKDIVGLETYVSTLETNLSSAETERAKIERQLIKALEKCEELEEQVNEATRINENLKTTVSNKELELIMFRDQYGQSHGDDTCLESSFLNGTLNTTPLEPENMGIVVEKLLSERVAENAALKESISELMTDKTHLTTELTKLQSRISTQDLEIIELRKMASELEYNLGDFAKTCEDLEKVREQLSIASKTLDEVTSTNIELTQSKNSMSEILLERESELAESKKANEGLKSDFIKLSEDLKKAQKNLEEELKNVSRLTMESEEKHVKLQESLETLSLVNAEHESARKCLEMVDSDLSRYIGKLGKFLRTTGFEERSSESFISCSSVEMKLDKLTDLLGQLEIQDLETAESRATLESTCIQLNENISSLKSEIFELEDSQRSSIRQKMELEECLKCAEEKMSQLQITYTSKINSLKRELEEKIKRIADLDYIISQANENQEKLLREKEALIAELDKLKVQCTEAEIKIDYLEEKIMSNENDHMAKISAVTSELDQVNKKLKQLQKSHQLALQEREDSIKEKDAKLKETNSFLNKLKTRMASLETKLKKTEEEKLELLKVREKDLQTHEELTVEKTCAMEELRKIKKEIERCSNVESQLNEEKKSVQSLTSEVRELESKQERIRQISQEMKSNVKVLRLILSKAPLCRGDTSKELQVIYDSCKEITESASQLSVVDEGGQSDYVTVCDENASHTSVLLSHHSSGVEMNKDDPFNVDIELEELQLDILTAKKSLMAFLQASIKHFEVLKIKDNLISEMTKEQQSLENRISSLTELNTRLTKEILESKTISKIETDFKEQELEILREEVESLKSASEVLKQKLSEWEKINESLVKREQESTEEISLLREKNKSLTNDLQTRVMSQLRQQNACWGIVRSKQGTELELERALSFKKSLEKLFAETRKKISKHKNHAALQIALNAVEQNFFIVSQKLLYATYSCLKWTEKNIEHQCLLIGRGDADNSCEKDISENIFREELETIQNKLKSTVEELNRISEQVKEIDRKCSVQSPEIEELSDSLEELPVGSKTFDVIHLDGQVNDQTFCIKAPSNVEKDAKQINTMKNCNSWVVSPPSKTKPKEPVEQSKRRRAVKGETWVVPLNDKPKNEVSMTKFHSACELQTERPVKCEKKSSISRSSSLSSITDIDYSPPPKKDLEASQTTFETAVNDADSKKTFSEVSMPDPEGKSDSDTFASETVLPLVSKFTESLKKYAPAGDSKKVVSEDFCHSKEAAMQDKLALEKKIWKLQKEVLENVKECENYKNLLRECEQKRKKDKENYEKAEEIMRQTISSKYESQLEHLKSEMKALYNRELAKHKGEQSKLSTDLREQNKAYKEHIDELRNQLWDLGEKLLHEQKLKRDLERNMSDLKKRYERLAFSTEQESKSSHCSDFMHHKEAIAEETARVLAGRQFPSSTFPTIPTEDEDEVFDNRCLEDMKAGLCQVEGPEGRLTELQYRNSLCLPHLKSSYPAETQFHNPKVFKENDLKFGHLQFAQESQSLTDSDHSMTRSLLPDEKGRRKEQTSYKRPGPPTPSKNGGRPSLQSGDLRFTPKNVLRESNDLTERSKGTPSKLKLLFRSYKRESIGGKDENTAPVTPRGKKLKIFRPRKPFGGRDN